MILKPKWCDTDKLSGQILLNTSLADFTTWRVGGDANLLYKPADLADLSSFMKILPSDEPLFWIGLGSNLLVRDNGVKGTVILTQGNLAEIALVGDSLIRVEAGVSCAKMARFCARCDLSGGEFWAGIPGTMGGALKMNAGCFNGETWDRVVSVETIDRKGHMRVRKPSDYKVTYRHIEGIDDEWFVAATCKLVPGDKKTSLQTIKDLLARRALTQPTSEYNCGSVFRNPEGSFAAKLIESCDLKGTSLGGAVVSQKHANFIINKLGLASALDIESLILSIQQDVYKKTQVQLRPEVHIIGERYVQG